MMAGSAQVPVRQAIQRDEEANEEGGKAEVLLDIPHGARPGAPTSASRTRQARPRPLKKPHLGAARRPAHRAGPRRRRWPGSASPGLHATGPGTVWILSVPAPAPTSAQGEPRVDLGR